MTNGLVGKKYRSLLEADIPDVEVVRGLIYGSDCIGKSMYDVTVSNIDRLADSISELIMKDKIRISTDKIDALQYAKDNNACMVDWCSDNVRRRMADIMVYTKALEVLERARKHYFSKECVQA